MDWIPQNLNNTKNNEILDFQVACLQVTETLYTKLQYNILQVRS